MKDTFVEETNGKMKVKCMDTRAKVLPQYAAAIAANLAACVGGAALGWTSPALPKLSHITPNEGSWIGASLSLGGTVGPFLAAALADRLGRRRTLLYLGPPCFLLGWSFLLSPSTWVLLMCFGRFLIGVAGGITFTVVPMYLGEIAEARIRGALGSLMCLFALSGVLYVYIIGPLVSYLALGCACIVLTLVFTIALFFVPESPYQLLMTGENDQASRSLQWLRGLDTDGVREELDSMQNSIEQEMQVKSNFKDLWTSAGNFKALYLCVGLVGLQQLSGANAVLFYSQNIFETGGSDVVSPAIATVIIGVVMTASSGFTSFLIDRFGRRVLLLTSAVFMAISEVALGIFFYLKTKSYDMDSIGWLPIVSLVVFVSLYSLGFASVPWTILGELFPTDVKSNASALTTSSCWFFCFIVTCSFSEMEILLGTHWVFWIYSIFCFIAIAFVFFLLPETKGKSFQEIQQLLNKDNVSCHSSTVHQRKGSP